jgi:hypothetical protein
MAPFNSSEGLATVSMSSGFALAFPAMHNSPRGGRTGTGSRRDSHRDLGSPAGGWADRALGGQRGTQRSHISRPLSAVATRPYHVDLHLEAIGSRSVRTRSPMHMPVSHQAG